VETYEIKEDAEKAYTADIQKRMKDTVWTDSRCRSWYKNEKGWNSTLYPYVYD